MSHEAYGLVSLVKGLSPQFKPLKTIAVETGFCNAGHLANVFKRETGLTAVGWRNSVTSAGITGKFHTANHL